MRLLLLLALCLRFVPAPLPMTGAAHCGTAAAAAPAGHEDHAAHHGTQGAAAAGEHAECPHCPPTDCARHDHCPQPGLLFTGAGTIAALGTPADRAVPRPVVRVPPSTSHAPPVRPPLLPLA